MPVFGDASRALRPQSSDCPEPTRNGEAKSALDGVRRIPELLREATRPQERDACRTASQAPAFPDKPDVEIKQSGCIRQGSHNLALDRNPMLVAFAEEGVAEGDGVLKPAVFAGGIGIGEPQAHAFEEVESSAIGHPVAARLVVGAKKDCGRKYSLKPLHDPSIMPTVFGEVEKIEHLRCATKMDDSAILLESERRDPDRDEPILTVRQTKARMAGDFKEEFSVPAEVGKLVSRWTAERDPAENERPGIVSELLMP